MNDSTQRTSELKRRWIREPFSGLSHLAGAALSIAGLVVLLVLARGRPWYVVSFAVYGASLICLYTASALYHSLPVAPQHLDQLKRFDHVAIYLLIAGSYGPLCLTSIRGGWGWSLFGVVYGLALLGILASLFWRRAPEWVRVVLYLLMGWLAVVAIGPLHRAMPPAAFAWLVVGGVLYTVGAVVYAANRPHLWPGRFSAHDLWHLFVLGGSGCHFAMMVRLAAAA
jgi:hemolysin III